MFCTLFSGFSVYINLKRTIFLEKCHENCICKGSAIFLPQMGKDARLLEISGKFQICPVNPSSLSDNLSDNLKKKTILSCLLTFVYNKYLTKSHLIVNNHRKQQCYLPWCEIANVPILETNRKNLHPQKKTVIRYAIIAKIKRKEIILLSQQKRVKSISV